MAPTPEVEVAIKKCQGISVKDIECVLSPGLFVTMHSRITHFINANLNVWCYSFSRTLSLCCFLPAKTTDLYSGSPYSITCGLQVVKDKDN